MSRDTHVDAEAHDTHADPPRLLRAAGSLREGESVDRRYRVAGFLGSGGMGEVYEVEHLRLGRRLALKVLRHELGRDAKLIERFERESRTVASLHSEHVVGILDSGALLSGAPYFVMELLRGEDLRSLLARSGALPASRAANIGIDACRGLDVAHAAGLVHRDLKPENLFVSRGDDGRDVCKLLDFGVAKILSDNATMPGALIGTARYMAPEQAGADTALGPHTDVYSLGVILYECLAGRVPFEAETLERLLFKVMNHDFVPLERARPELPRGLTRAISRALAKDPSARYPSARSFAEALLSSSGRSRSWAVAREITAALSIETASDPGVAKAMSASTRSSSSRGRIFGVMAVAAIAGGLALGQDRTQIAVQAVATPQPDAARAARLTQPAGPPPVEAPPAAAAPAAGPRIVSGELAPASARVAAVTVAHGAPAAARKLGNIAPPRAESRRDPEGTAQPPLVSFDPQNPYGREIPAAR